MSLPKLPGLSSLRDGDSALLDWTRTVTEHLETLEGVRGGDRVAMMSDLDGLSSSTTGTTRAQGRGDITLDLGDGKTASVSLDAIVEKLVSNRRMQEAFAQVGATDLVAQNPSSTASQVQNLLQSQIDTATKTATDAAAAAQAAAKDAYAAMQKAIDGTGGTSRGSIVAMGSLANFNTNAWRDDVAIWCIQQNLGVNKPGVTPTATDTQNLVTGDMVTLLGADGTTVITKQWIKSMGWMLTGPFVGGNIILDNSVPTAKVKSTMLGSLDQMFGTYAGTYYAAGTITVNYGGLSLNTIANRAAAARTPIWCYGNIGIPAFPSTAWDDDLATWCILLNILNVAPSFSRPMPRGYLVAGDTVNLRTVDGTTANITKTWNGSYWA